VSYIGNAPISAAFLTDTFSGTGSQTAFTMTVAPANTSSIIVAVTGVLQDPSTYSVSGTTLTFSTAPPSGTSNISVRYLGIPASGVTTTAYRTVTEFTATSGQTSFSTPSYTVGYIDVYRNGVMLGTADFTATTGTTVVLASGATTGDLIRTESFYVSSVLNAIPATAGSINSSYLASGVARANWGAGGVLQVVQGTYSTATTTTSTSYVDTGLTATITPSSASNKVLVSATISLYSYGGGQDSGCKFQLVRGSTNLITPVNNSIYVYNPNSGSEIVVTFPLIYLDSPATTSATIYKLQMSATDSGTVIANVSGNIAVMQLMEIAA